MDKFLLMSVIFATVLIPAATSGLASPREGLKRAIVRMLVFNVCYMLAVAWIWPRLIG